MTQEEITRTAYHESGHAVAAFLLGGKIDHLAITPVDDLTSDFLSIPADGFPNRTGEIRVIWPEGLATDSELAVREIKVSLAGPVVEMIFDGSQFAPEFIEEWRYDWELAVDRATEFLPRNKPVVEHLAQFTFELMEFFERDDAWAAVAALADELEAHETLETEQIEDVIAAWPIG